MLKDKTIICISTIDWEFLRQRHQILMEAFASQGNRVIYIENLNPSPGLNIWLLPKLFKRLGRIFLKGKTGEKNLPANITVITPLLIPFKDKLSVFLNKKILLWWLAARIRKTLPYRPIVWTYLATATTLELIRRLNPGLLVYDCVFDALLHPNSPKDIEASQEQLIKSSQFIFTDNQHLLKKCAALNPRTYLIPPGVEAQAFSYAQAPGDAKMVANIARPRLCFFGGIDGIRLDLDLIAGLAEENPRWNIILFGPVIKTDVSCLRKKNIFLPGTLTHEKLPKYLKLMDVLILPYKIKPFTRSIFPAKIFECLASGKPVVATALPELIQFKGYLAIANTRKEFTEAVQEALLSDNQEARAARIKMADENSWQERLIRISEIIERSQT